ncbi:ATP-binding cassette domain-containing protein [Plantactinospora sp. S1510]|uniref:ATP-binding cassette domain-containing protein n=1 Tax=Plantactinospora alkalitolerans TaxID=2789879 RepID=A0ABS0GSC7_9ACTN|nr:ATP-binding cassette domain-containing protein [Plantactinospora alkalitolerans]MBF9129090.1 ATP-binding cassette domain-containing protein [Plantactinospora alkalitolerans]
MSDPIVTVDEVTKQFRDGTRALDGLSLTIPRGIIYGLLGPNGAGKTTLIRILATLLRPDSGTVRIAGFDVTRHPTAVRDRIGLAGQFAAVDDHLTGRENIAMIGRLYGLPRREANARTEQVLQRIHLADAADRPVRTYSGGMRRRIDLAASLVGRPQVLFLDEPTTGVDPASRQDLWHLVRDLAAEGTTVLLTTQYLDEADQLAGRIAVINHGRLLTEGTATELKDRTGGAVVELDIAAGQRDVTLRALEPLDAQFATDRGRIVLPAPDGPLTLRHALRLLDQADITPTDVALHRPTLDDVFLTLTRPNTTDRIAARRAA